VPAGQGYREVLHVPRAPRPRVGLGELGEPTDQPDPVADGLLTQQPGGLLTTPPGQHRLENGALLVQMSHPGDQDEPRRAGYTDHQDRRSVVAAEAILLPLTLHLVGRPWSTDTRGDVGVPTNPQTTRRV